MEHFRVTVVNEVGLHARPASVFVTTATQFEAQVRVRNATTGSDWADAKSILSVLLLGVERDHEVEIEIEGSDEGKAAQTLRELFASEFKEAA